MEVELMECSLLEFSKILQSGTARCLCNVVKICILHKALSSHLSTNLFLNDGTIGPPSPGRKYCRKIYGSNGLLTSLGIFRSTVGRESALASSLP
jgi:hypothetical protein